MMLLPVLMKCSYADQAQGRRVWATYFGSVTSILFFEEPETNSLLMNRPVGCSYDVPFGSVILVVAGDMLLASGGMV